MDADGARDRLAANQVGVIDVPANVDGDRWNPAFVGI
jgi:hypothetical protein